MERELLRRTVVMMAVARALFALAGTCVLAAIVAACSSKNGGITAPTVASEVLVHDTMNLADDHSVLDIEASYRTTITPIISNLEPYRWDDFTSSVTTTIRTVSWQGGYCAARVPVPVGPPTARAISFQVGFYSDSNGRPRNPFNGGGLGDVYAVTLSPAEAHEQFVFEAMGSEADCAYYDYMAVLPIPVSLTAGTRYWLLIRADLGGGPLGSPWGWRVGLADNGISASGSFRSISLAGISTSPRDLAFSLSSQ